MYATTKYVQKDIFTSQQNNSPLNQQAKFKSMNRSPNQHITESELQTLNAKFQNNYNRDHSLW